MAPQRSRTGNLLGDKFSFILAQDSRSQSEATKTTYLGQILPIRTGRYWSTFSLKPPIIPSKKVCVLRRKFSTSLVIEYSGSDTYIESIWSMWNGPFLPLQNTLNESQGRRPRSRLASRFGGARSGLLHNRFSFHDGYMPRSVYVRSSV